MPPPVAAPEVRAIFVRIRDMESAWRGRPAGTISGVIADGVGIPVASIGSAGTLPPSRTATWWEARATW